MGMVSKLESTEVFKDYIGEDFYKRQACSRHVCIPLENGAYFLAFYWCDIKNIRRKDERMCLFCGKNGIVYTGNSAFCSAILKSLPETGEPFSLLAEFFSQMTARDIDELERIESSISELELSLINTEKPMHGVSKRISEFRRSLIRMKRYYEQLSVVLEGLQEDENESIPAAAMKRLTGMGHRIRHLVQSVTELREYVTQVRETYQAQIDIEQNQIMKIFTVITAIFLPLTLIVGWYGMNFQIPEYGWQFGYLYVVILSIAVCGFCFWIFRKKKWF